ncbi:MAG: hypothetical protein CVT92_04185 [Bacteroidetes bacterium HGW-Bacteroidetes-1]|nr:MAG: hypothetical protein CVT92_04185 [Bacteroidetes bacterium HGW-Bacteroidetes-1]
MRKIFLFIFIILTLAAGAQSSSVQIHLRSGVSIPLLEFTSNDLKDGCFTQTGISTSLAISSQIYKQWGIVLQSGFQLHPVSVGILGYEKVKNDPFLLDITIRSEPYQIIHFAGGPSYTFFPVPKLRLSFIALAGMFLSKTPYQLHKPTYFLTGPPYYEITSSRDRSFAYGTGFNLGYNITSCYEIGVEGDLLRSKAGFSFISANGLRTDFKQITMLNLSVVLVLKVPYNR